MSQQGAELLKEIAEQEATLRFPIFNAEIALDIGMGIRSRFLNDQSGKFTNRGIVIHISTFTDHTLFAAAVGNEAEIGPNCWYFVEGKKNIVKRFGHCSYFIGTQLAVHGETIAMKDLHPPEYAPFGGAFPIWIKDVPSAPIGTIIVSGLEQENDHALVVDTLKEYIPKLESKST
ncbi:hypothetical protein BOTBODRAFT_51456 [Botryobasidium botryosum FD-172 SS1]|uniref:Uncharacterized protein n=1 Tax=Botryobasidium botryosum (strain FD-172 SS1) TaxID=930990 RepID=A0A067N8J1_BOTB1|nr:hypothetical protein BOTBODRAFT_51456 [Botryobasidium botryosum FD-172 SS1]